MSDRIASVKQSGQSKDAGKKLLSPYAVNSCSVVPQNSHFSMVFLVFNPGKDKPGRHPWQAGLVIN